MTEYLKPKFSVALTSEAYANGWQRIFGCGQCRGTGTRPRLHGDDSRVYCECDAGRRLRDTESTQ